MTKTSLLVLAMMAVIPASAQVVLTGPGTYNQNFDSLSPVGANNPWLNNLPTPMMQGWYSNQQTYDADSGTSFMSDQYSYGVTPSPERALGSIALPGALIVYGMRLNNASGGTFTGLTLSYMGEQWRSGSVLTDQLLFEYSTNAASLFSGTWSPVASLDFASVNNTGAGAIVGNLPANQSFRSGTISSLNWTNGTDMWVRWVHVGNASRHGLAIDDLKLNAVPEPLTLISMGAGCVALIGARRRRKSA